MRKKGLFIFQILVIIGVLLINKSVAYGLGNYNVDTSIKLKYRAHVENIGWQNYVSNEQIAGTTGQALRVEGMDIQLDNAPAGYKIKYQTHVQSIGWQDWVENGQLAGTTGKCLRVEAIRIVLEGVPSGYHIQYQAHVENIGWQDWVEDGGVAGTTGKELRIEALRIRVVKEVAPVSINYQTHVENIGWQPSVNDNAIAGTTDKNLGLEAFKVNLTNALDGMKIKYQAHVQNIGWQNWVQDGQIAGTTGKALSIEAYRIQLEGAPSDYHIAYQAFIVGEGWQSWVYDGQISGVVGRSLRVSAIRIKLVKSSNIASAIPIKTKFAIDIGHNAKPDTGADGYKFEDNLTREVGSKVISKLRGLGYTVIDTMPKYVSSVSDSLTKRVDVANNNEVDEFVSIHFNAGGGTGTEVWYASDTGKNLGQKVLQQVVNLGYKNRGMKKIGVDGQNIYVVKYTDAPSFLVECSFVDSLNDMNKYNSEELANAIVKGLTN